MLRKATTERAESPTLPLKRAWGTKKKKSVNLISKEQGDEGKTNRPSSSRQEKKHYKLPYSTDEAVRKNNPHPAREVRERGG